MSRIRSGSGYPFENVYAYLRAIRAGNHVFVSGTTARPPNFPLPWEKYPLNKIHFNNCKRQKAAFL